LQLISVVIPTWNRSVDVQSAVHSALRQSHRDLEVIVVVDGPQPATERALRNIADPRLRVITTPESVGLAEARNVGARSARGEWIAFLDDDDLWLRDKLEKQLRAASKFKGSHTLIVTQYLERTSTMERVWPETLPRDTCRFSEYIFCRRGMLLPSTYLASRALMLRVPFTKGLRHLEDTDWLLRAADDPLTKIGSVAEPLTIYNNVSTTGRESCDAPWRVFYVWGIANRRLFTDRAFSHYITRTIVPRAKEARASWRELFHLLSAALLLGSFNLEATLFFFASSIFARESKRKIRELLSPAARRARERAKDA